MKTTLLIFLIWIPDGSLSAQPPATASSDYIKHVYATEAQCTAAKEGDTQVFWNNKPGHRMIGTKQCTDGTNPAQVTIGNMTITVETVATAGG